MHAITWVSCKAPPHPEERQGSTLILKLTTEAVKKIETRGYRDMNEDVEWDAGWTNDQIVK